MKKIVLVLSIGWLPAFFSLSAQEATQNDDRFPAYQVDNQEFLSNVYVNEISSVAFHHFIKAYADIEGEKWIKTDQGFTVVGTNKHSALFDVLYNNKGAFQRGEKYHRASFMSADLRKMINRLFSDFDILSVTEISNPVNETFGVEICQYRLERTIEIAHGEVRTLTEFINPDLSQPERGYASCLVRRLSFC
jgi:hypothetical protein